MLNQQELEKLLTDFESNLVERTTSTEEKKLGQAVCAFSNDFPGYKLPGYILIGVYDDGSLSGQRFDDKIFQGIGGIKTNGNVLPQPSIVTEKYTFDEGDVIVIEVHPSFHPPVRYKGKTWIRTGPRRDIANETEERRLAEKRTASSKTFDVRPCPEANLEDLNIDAFTNTYLPNAVDKETLKANHRDLKEQMASLRFYDQVYDCPTNAGILMFGINPLFFCPGAYIQYVKIPDTEITPDIDFEQNFSGNLITEINPIDQFIQTNILKTRPLKNESLRETYMRNYPLWALRELILNAIIHRDYEANAPIYIYDFLNRIEIQNPGGLYGEVRPENFPDDSDYRNPVLAESMKVLGYVNRFNFGVKNAKKALADNGNPEPEFNLNLKTKFHVTVYINNNWL